MSRSAFSKRMNDVRFWVCVVGAALDVGLALFGPPELQELFLTCAVMFALGAVISYAQDG